MSTPLYATRRDPQAISLGARVAVVAQCLGTPLMPWQRLVADVATELDPTNPARWRYPVVVVTVPRQSGKTTLMRAIAIDRALARPDQLIFTTAQTGKDAGERWKDLADQVMRSPLRTRTKMYRGAGAQSIILPNRSRVRAFAPTPTSIHGYTPHLVMIDEAWAFDEVRGEDLMAAIRPAQITLPDRQLWIVSTKGDATSAFLDRWIDTGRAAINDPHAPVAYIEYAAAEDAPPYEPATLEFHPALGHTITLEDLLAEADSVSRGVWERSYLNRKTFTAETIIDLETWDAHAAAQTPPPSSTMAIGYDVHDGVAAVWAAWHDHCGRRQIRQVAAGDDVTWLVPFVADFVRTTRPRSVSADDAGPARAATDELRKTGIEVDTLTARDFATACSTMLRYAADPDALGHDGSPDLRDAWANAATKMLAGQKAFDRAHSSGPIADLIAATVAVRGLDHGRPMMPKPEVWI